MTSDDKVTYFGETDSRNKRIKFGIKAKDRTRHMYVIGKTGMGKSTLLENMAVQDIQGGEGLCFIDPHGKSADLLLEYIPEHRIKDVVYFAPFDIEQPIAFNVMEDVGYDKRHLVVSGLMSTFKKIWVDAWSARMEYILSNTLLALLEYPGATLLGVNKMYSDKVYRKKVVDNITDPAVRSFWVDEFAKYTEKFAAEATPAIQNKIGQFTNNPLIRNIIGQPKSSFDIRKMMDERKIMIVNLSKGRVGESNASLLGAMLITKIYLGAMSRADASESQLRSLPQFYLYVDEFQSFANESFADILSEARKYKLNLTIAHQYIEQMSDEVRAAVFGNVGTMIVFRVGSYDAEVLEKEFLPQFTAEDIVNLGQYQLYLRLMINGVGSQPFSARNLPPIAPPAQSFKDMAIQSSRANYGQVRAIVEEQVKMQTASDEPAKPVERRPDTRQDSRQDSRQDGPRQDSRQDDRAPRRDNFDRRDTPRDSRDNAPRRDEGRASAPTHAPISTPVSVAPQAVAPAQSAQTPRRESSTPVASALAPTPQNFQDHTRAPRDDRRNDRRDDRRNDRRDERPPRVERPAPPLEEGDGFSGLASLKAALPLVTHAAPANARPMSGRPLEKKGITQESRNDLKAALASLIKDVAKPSEAKAPEGDHKREERREDQRSQQAALKREDKPREVQVDSPKDHVKVEMPKVPQPPREEKQAAPKPLAATGPNEVPEDVLKRILEI